MKPPSKRSFGGAEASDVPVGVSETAIIRFPFV